MTGLVLRREFYDTVSMMNRRGIGDRKIGCLYSGEGIWEYCI